VGKTRTSDLSITSPTFCH